TSWVTAHHKRGVTGMTGTNSTAMQRVLCDSLAIVENMKKALKDGVTLAYEERGSGSKSILFIHGLGFDHSTFEPQMEFFGQSAHVIAVDLRGHGESDAPHQNYAMPAFAED